jgi:hypothetical protein
MIARMATALIPTIAFLTGATALVLLCIAVWLESLALTNPPWLSPAGSAALHLFGYAAHRCSKLDFEDVEFAAPNGEAVARLARAGAERRQNNRNRRPARARRQPHGDARHPVLCCMTWARACWPSTCAKTALSAGAGRGMALGIRESEDAIAAAAEMRRRGYDKVIVLGCSLGGSSAILAAARDGTIDGVIAESPLASFRSLRR